VNSAYLKRGCLNQYQKMNYQGTVRLLVAQVTLLSRCNRDETDAPTFVRLPLHPKTLQRTDQCRLANSSLQLLLTSIKSRLLKTITRMRACQVLSLFAGLVLVTEVTSHPVLESAKEQGEEDLHLSKRGKATLEGHLGQATRVQNGNSHLSTAAAHFTAGTSKLGTLPASGAIGLGRNVGDILKHATIHEPTERIRKVGGSIAEALFIHPTATLAKIITHPVVHGGFGVKHAALAGKNYFQAATSKGNSPHTHAEVDERLSKAWKGVVTSPVDHAMNNVMVDDFARTKPGGRMRYKYRKSLIDITR
jgi:hypothetical protein